LTCPPGVVPGDVTYDEAINNGDPFVLPLTDRKNEFYWACRGRYNTTLDRCEDCLKKADEHCDQTDTLQKEQCIRNWCDNYTGIDTTISGPPIVDGLDFYNRCLIEEKKDSCYTCLKEYFMPSTYCDQTKDYIGRSIIKYPAIVHMDISGGDDCAQIIGLDDDAITDQGGECNDICNRYENIDVALICRILPEYAYGGQQICRTWCSGATEEQLRDITDFRPNKIDCNNTTVPGDGGKEPWNVINDGTMRIRGKCCATFWQHDASQYAICVGSGETTTVDPPEDHANQFCPAAVAACGDGINPNWDATWNPSLGLTGGWESQTVIDGGGLTNRSIEFKDQWFQQALSGTVSNARLITLVDPNVVIRVTSPYCWKPQQCCTDDSSYSACMGSIPDQNSGISSWNRCRISTNEKAQGYTNERNLALGYVGGSYVNPNPNSTYQRAGDLEPMWVPDSGFRDGEEWKHYGYCSFCPESNNPENCMFGPLDIFAWHQAPDVPNQPNATRYFSDGTRAVWQDNNQSGDTCYNQPDCTGRCDTNIENFKPIDLAGEWWIAIRGNGGNNQGGAAICEDR